VLYPLSYGGYSIDIRLGPVRVPKGNVPARLPPPTQLLRLKLALVLFSTPCQAVGGAGALRSRLCSWCC
jgi:hypothetical protein